MKLLARTAILVIVLTSLVSGPSSNRALACPNCKEAVSLDAGEVSQMSTGYNWSVVFMLAVPFSLLGTGAFMVRRAVKQGTLPEM